MKVINQLEINSRPGSKTPFAVEFNPDAWERDPGRLPPPLELIAIRSETERGLEYRGVEFSALND